MKDFVKILLTILIFVLLIFIEFSIISHNSLFGIKPNLLLIIIVILTLFFKEPVSLGLSLCVGILADIIYISNGVGVYTLLYTLVSGVLMIVKNNFIKLNEIAVVYLSIIATLVYEVAYFLILVLGYSAEISFFRLIFSAILSIVLNSALTLAIYNILRKLYLKENPVNIYLK